MDEVNNGDGHAPGGDIGEVVLDLEAGAAVIDEEVRNQAEAAWYKVEQTKCDHQKVKSPVVVPHHVGNNLLLGVDEVENELDINLNDSGFIQNFVKSDESDESRDFARHSRRECEKRENGQQVDSQAVFGVPYCDQLERLHHNLFPMVPVAGKEGKEHIKAEEHLDGNVHVEPVLVQLLVLNCEGGLENDDYGTAQNQQEDKQVPKRFEKVIRV